MTFENLKCPVHGFKLVSMPRPNERADLKPEDMLTPWIAKCPLKACVEGIRRAASDGELRYVEV